MRQKPQQKSRDQPEQKKFKNAYEYFDSLLTDEDDDWLINW